jgi:carboxypeptidase C (cathepsin A)
MWHLQRLECFNYCASITGLPWWLLLFLSFGLPIKAQYPPPSSQDNVTTVRSPVDSGVTVTWKTPLIGTCTTVFSTQKQYSGYINLPPSVTGQNYTINTFFWFFEARQVPETAPLTIFINGGPGSSSMVGLFQEVGPCQVVEISEDKLGTVAREWGWDRSSNIIFIDQPVQVGFSFDVLTNASLNLIDDLLSYPPSQIPNTQPSYTFLNGTFGSGNPNNSASTSGVAAQAVWHFLQAFLGVFPRYNPAASPDGVIVSGTTGINLFTESYGGKFGPAIGAFFAEQNALRQTNPVMMNSTLEITLATLGIMNGWIDLVSSLRGCRLIHSRSSSSMVPKYMLTRFPVRADSILPSICI